MKIFKTKKRIVLFVFLCCLAILVIRHFYNENRAFYLVPYEKQDITEIIKKDNISDDEYLTIFEQTGISPYAVKELIAENDTEQILKLQDMYFKKPEIKKNYIAYPVTAEERNEGQKTPLANVKKGDILVTFNTHTLDWRHGHCGIVLDEKRGITLEHMSIGNVSTASRLAGWGSYPAFIVLRYEDEKVAEKAAEYAEKHLIGIDYNILAGVLKKDKSGEEVPTSSHCSHIVWQAYKAVGVDIDQNGGILVLPSDIAMSEELKVVQIYGINPKDYKDRILK